jgi:cytochrome b6-f complex iron-sulfur subunit
MSCTRRDVLRGLAAGAACGAVGCGGGGLAVDGGVTGDGPCTSLLCVSLTNPSNSALRSVGGSQVFSTPNGGPVILIRTDATTVAALSDICTHAGCGVTYQAARGELVCPCHGSIFSLTGQVLRGPALTPLKVYSATLDTATNTVDVT